MLCPKIKSLFLKCFYPSMFCSLLRLEGRFSAPGREKGVGGKERGGREGGGREGGRAGGVIFVDFDGDDGGGGGGAAAAAHDDDDTTADDSGSNNDNIA